MVFAILLITWIVLSLPLAVLLGRALRRADIAEGLAVPGLTPVARSAREQLPLSLH